MKMGMRARQVLRAAPSDQSEFACFFQPTASVEDAHDQRR